MKVRVHIAAMSVEAGWSRARRADFAEALRVALGKEIAAAARRGAFRAGDGGAPRRKLTIPALALSSPVAAGKGVARVVSGEIARGGKG